MVTRPLLTVLVAKLNERKKRLLLMAEAVVPQERQFDAYRKLLLDELGRDGFEKDLEETLKQYLERQGTGGNTYAGKGVPK